MKRRDVITLLIFLLPSLSWAYSVIQKTLQERFDSTANILLARVLTCDDASLSEPDDRSATICSIKTLELFKGKPFTEVSVYNSYCGLEPSLKNERQYLLFLDEEGRIAGCRGGSEVDPEVNSVSQRQIVEAQRDGESPELMKSVMISRANEQLEKIRQYVKGSRTDLIDYWLFTDNDYSCQLQHRLPRSSQGGSFTAQVMYTERLPDWVSISEYTIVFPASTTIDEINPAQGVPGVMFMVPFGINLSEQPGLLKIEDTNVALQPLVIELISHKIVMNFYYVKGPDAEAILELLDTASSVTVVLNEKTPEKEGAYASFTPDLMAIHPSSTVQPQLIQVEPKEYTIDTYGIADALAQFNDCRAKAE